MPLQQIASRRRAAFLLLALYVGIATFLFWPARDATPVLSPPLGGSSQGYAGPENYLAWVPGGFDDPNFRQKMERLTGLDEAVVVAGDTLWLRKTQDADGRVVDEPTRPFAFPIDVFAVEADDYAPFVGTSVRDRIVRALSAGKAVLGQHSARLRRLGPGGKLTFRTGSVRVGAIVPDGAVGWSEVLLDRQTGRRLGITHERYLLAQMSRDLTRPAWKRKLMPFVGDNPLRVDLPGSTPYVRVASGVRPPILVKEVFGEFAATPQSDPAWLTIDPAWVERNIVTTEVPLLGTITCHRKLIPMVRGAIEEMMGDSGYPRQLVGHEFEKLGIGTKHRADENIVVPGRDADEIDFRRLGELSRDRPDRRELRLNLHDRPDLIAEMQRIWDGSEFDHAFLDHAVEAVANG